MKRFFDGCLRLFEPYLPVWCLRILLWPAAAAAAGWDLLRGRTVAGQLEHLPASLKPASRRTWLWRVWRWHRCSHFTRFVLLWADRFQQPKWQRQCRYVGFEQVERLCTQGQPVILATLHFGPLWVLRYWLRARGLLGATLVSEDWKQNYSTRRQRAAYWIDRVAGSVGVPYLFTSSQLKQIHQFLQPRRFLLFTVDVPNVREVLVRGDDFTLRMATGAVRLAARVNAAVVPCLIVSNGSLSFMISFGTPVPGAWIADKTQHPAACTHLLNQFLPVVRTWPEQSSSQLLTLFQTSAPGPDRSGGETLGAA